jgi:hypothetical protein
MDAPTLTTTGLGSCHHIRHDYPDWFCATKGNSIDAPNYIPTGEVFWAPRAERALVALLDREYAFRRFA